MVTKLDGNQSFSEPYGHLHITAPCIPVEEAVTPSENDLLIKNSLKAKSSHLLTVLTLHTHSALLCWDIHRLQRWKLDTSENRFL